MGADWVRKAAKTFEKSWDRGRVELATADLFTQQPSCAGRAVEADIVGNAHLSPGDAVTVQATDEGLVAMRGLSVVARINRPSLQLIEVIQASCCGGIVEQVHPLSGVAEISVW